MIHRIILIRLHERYRRDTSEVARRIQELLRSLPMLAGSNVEAATDEATRARWDLLVEVHYRTASDGVSYLADPSHNAFVTHYLKARTESREAWVFGTEEPMAPAPVAAPPPGKVE